MDEFRERVWGFYRREGRDHLPWRQVVTPYGVYVSEIMLQQTQVSRVLERWGRWLERFAGFAELAAAPTRELLEEWQGMGYNRRALWLKAGAERIMTKYGGELPREVTGLIQLSGVGPNTAGSIAAFAYDEPTVFIETNIRRAFLHEFFDEAAVQCASYPDGVPDRELRPLVETAVQAVVAEGESPREWYWALMDYGADLAKRVPNPNRRSRHYAVQSRFEGSVRQLRGEVLRRLLAGPQTEGQLRSGEGGTSLADPRLGEVLAALEREGFVRREGEVIMLQ